MVRVLLQGESNLLFSSFLHDYLPAIWSPQTFPESICGLTLSKDFPRELGVTLGSGFVNVNFPSRVT